MPIPTPEPGLVISYAYVWEDEARRGQQEGRKNRPCVIALAVQRHLGLDDERSWVVVSEGDKFVWPGYDLRKVPGTGRYDFGFLPPRFFKEVLAAVRAWHKARKVTLTQR